MTKRTKSESRRRRHARPDPKAIESVAGGGESNWLSSAATRETIESVIIAFVLAFLFRTFEAEAFVIPTGSMAPTLMGKHKDLECPMCGCRYQANSSDVNDKPVAVLATTCPTCRYTMSVVPGNPQGKTYESYDGDRILVAKFPYEFDDPKRWDVVVFKYPGDATMNYIKRLVGKPGETIRIQYGDLWIRGPDDADFTIARKPPEKVLAMLQLVYDNDNAPTINGKLKWPARWTAGPSADGYSWSEAGDPSCFGTKGSGKGEAWIRYRHCVPNEKQWVAAISAAAPDLKDRLSGPEWLKYVKEHLAPAGVKPQLISDFAAYNSARLPRPRNDLVRPSEEPPNGIHWVGDLAVQFELESTPTSGKVIAELVKGGWHFRCRLDVASGVADMSISRGGVELEKFHPKATTAVKGAGKHTIIFSNVDDELRLWVDPGWRQSGVVAFDAPTTYDSRTLQDHIPKLDDLAPVGIGAEGAAAQVRHIKVFRDVYYIADAKGDLTAKEPLLAQESREHPHDVDYYPYPLTDFTKHFPVLVEHENCEKDWAGERGFSDDNMWTVDLSLDRANPADPAKDRFLVLGDNSAQSQDCRLWSAAPDWHGGEKEYWVDREMFIGKALFIYWPHGWPVQVGQTRLVPYVNPVPNFGRMHLVR